MPVPPFAYTIARLAAALGPAYFHIKNLPRAPGYAKSLHSAPVKLNICYFPTCKF